MVMIINYKEHINTLFKNNYVHKIFGTAGAGKTTFLIDELDKLFEKGIDPKQIAFVSFTNKAVNEIVDRCTSKFKQFHPQQFVHFRTIHSMCYKTINCDEKAVIQHKELMRLAKNIGMQVSSFQNIEDGAGAKQGDKIINIEALARLKMIDLEEQWRNSKEKDCPLFLLQEWRRTLNVYKEKNNLVDFTDMLEEFDTHLNVKYVFIDEAQDLCPLQWRVMNVASHKADQVYIAGDDDQSIFTWAGAVVDYFLNIKTDEETVLRHSYRLPSNIYHLSRKILSRIKNRKEKECQPINDKGTIKNLLSFEHINIDRDEDYLILIRNRWQVKIVEEWLKKNGYIYINFNKNILDTDEVVAIQNWNELKSAGKIEKRKYRKIQKYSKVLKNYNYDELTKDIKQKEWYQVLNGISRQTIDYLKNVTKYHSLTDIPKIKISTIHQAKGGEADNVILFTDVSYNVWNNLHTDAEHKVWYVAITRAKQNLYIIKEQSSKYYCI